MPVYEGCDLHGTFFFFGLTAREPKVSPWVGRETIHSASRRHRHRWCLPTTVLAAFRRCVGSRSWFRTMEVHALRCRRRTPRFRLLRGSVALSCLWRGPRDTPCPFLVPPVAAVSTAAAVPGGSSRPLSPPGPRRAGRGCPPRGRGIPPGPRARRAGRRRRLPSPTSS